MKQNAQDFLAQMDSYYHTNLKWYGKWNSVAVNRGLEGEDDYIMASFGTICGRTRCGPAYEAMKELAPVLDKHGISENEFVAALEKAMRTQRCGATLDWFTKTNYISRKDVIAALELL